MNDLVCGSITAITREAEPAWKSRRAIRATACGVVRSVIPNMTTPLPSGITSPPSTVAGPQSVSTPPYQTSNGWSAKSGWWR